MRGVNRTAELKFEHPGLGTTATRSGGRLVLQNDIGTTDAHVLVVHVEGGRVTLTYTDVHMQRLMFFQGLFEARRVDWEDTLSRTDRTMEDGVYHLCIGTFAAATDAELEDYLAFMGSRLVFLIDWNRARKRLRLLLPKKDVAELLKWAADNDHGHMAFLRAGGEQMIFDCPRVRLAHARLLRRPPRRRAGARRGREVHALRHADLRAGAAGRTPRGAGAGRGARRAGELLPLRPGERPRRLRRARGVRARDRERHPRRAPRRGGPGRGRRIRAQRPPRQGVGAPRRRARERRAGAGAPLGARAVLPRPDRGRRRHRGRARGGGVPPGAHAPRRARRAAVRRASPARRAGRGERAGIPQGGGDRAHAASRQPPRGHAGLPRGRPPHHVPRAAQRRGPPRREGPRPAQPGDFGSLFGFIECARNLEAATDALMHTALKLRDAVLGELVVQ